MSIFSFKLDATEVQTKFKSLSKSVKNFQEPLNEAGEDLLDIYSNKVFEEQGKKEKWQPLSVATLMARQKRTGHYKNPPVATNKILVWTGRLKNGFFKTVNTVSLTIANNVPYFGVHQKGDGKIPKRQMLYLDNDIVKVVMNRVNKYVNRSMK